VSSVSELQKQAMTGTRQVLASDADFRDAMIAIARLAVRNIAIMTRDLPSIVFDDREFIDAVKHLCLSRSYARIRVLVTNPYRTLRDGNRFVYLGRRLSSFVEFRHVHQNYRDHNEAFMIVDNSALVFRADADRWEGIADANEPTIARRYLNVFDEIWAASIPAHEFRQLHIS
jgi:hypothetical protein